MNSITDVGGIRVGHHQRLDPDASFGAGWACGVTVVLTPPGTVGAVDCRGGAPGTRETDLLDPVNSVRFVDAVLLANVVYGSDMGMTELGERKGFLAKPPAGVIIRDQAGGKNLDGYKTFQLFIARAVYGAHAPGADGLNDGVAP